MSSRIVITDPHGCYLTLVALISKLPAGIPITIAGDLIDRGPRSMQVLEFVKHQGYDLVLGNHEIMMLDELKLYPADENGPAKHYIDNYHGIWTMNGGAQTMKSYLYTNELGHVDYNYKLLQEHLHWLKTKPYYLHYPEIKDAQGQSLLVTHSTAAKVWDKRDGTGVDQFTFRNHVLWERNPFPPKIEGVFNIYGHTPQQNGPTVKEHFACIDNGVYLKPTLYGKLYALVFPEMTLFSQDCLDYV